MEFLSCLLPSTGAKTFSYIEYIQWKTNRGKAICITQPQLAILSLQNVASALIVSRNLQNIEAVYNLMPHVLKYSKIKT